jgi:hypothetical protein
MPQETVPYDFGIVGAGRMGASIAGQLALSGARVALYDRSEFDIQKGFGIMRADMQRLVDEKLLAPRDRDDALERVLPVSKIAECVKSSLVLEVIFEDLNVKHTLFRQLEQACQQEGRKGKTMLASNTMSFPASDIEAGMFESSAYVVCGVRFLYPVFFVPLVEISAAEETLPDRLVPVRDLLVKFGFEPFYKQAIAGSYWRYRLGQQAQDVFTAAQRRKMMNKVLEEGEAIMMAPSRTPVKLSPCSICLENLGDCILAPCGHENICESCAGKIRRQTNCCPTCRVNIERVLLKTDRIS